MIIRLEKQSSCALGNSQRFMTLRQLLRFDREYLRDRMS